MLLIIYISPVNLIISNFLSGEDASDQILWQCQNKKHTPTQMNILIILGLKNKSKAAVVKFTMWWAW